MPRPTFTRTELEILKLWKRLIVALNDRAHRIHKFLPSDTEGEIIRWTKNDRVAMWGPNPLRKDGLVMRLESLTLEVEMQILCEGDEPDAFMCVSHSGKVTKDCLRRAIKVASES